MGVILAEMEPVLPTKTLRGFPRISSRMLENMRSNPKSGWTIKDFETACRQLDLVFSPPSHGSHFKISSPHFGGILMVPHKRPIKKWYVKDFIKFADTHIKCSGESGR